MTISDAPQRSEAWYEARRGLPTCSRFDMILTAVTAKPASQQDRLINELIAESVMPPQEGVIRHLTEEMEYGMKLEAEARCFYDLSLATAPVREVGFVLADHGLFGGSPDALVGDDGGVEIKCPSPVTHIGYLRDGALPDGYKQQLHGYLVVTGRKYWDFLSYSRHFPEFKLRIERDSYTSRLEEELFKFCARYNAERLKFGLPKIGK